VRPGFPATGPASSPATDRGTVSRTCRNQGPRVLQVRRNQESRRRAAASHRTGSAAATLIELSRRPSDRRRLRPPLPRRDRPCRNEGPRASSSRTRSTAASRCQPLPASSSSSAQPASSRSCSSRPSRSSPAQQLAAAAAAADRRCAAAGCSSELAKQAHRCTMAALPCKGRPSPGDPQESDHHVEDRRSSILPRGARASTPERAAEPVSSGSGCRGSVRRAPVPRCRYQPPAASPASGRRPMKHSRLRACNES
jgi:hypothetical protein